VGVSTDDDHLTSGSETDATNWSDDDWAPGWGGLEDDYEIITPSSDDGVGSSTDDAHLAGSQLRRTLSSAK
jgi:hypothetical protein